MYNIEVLGPKFNIIRMSEVEDSPDIGKLELVKINEAVTAVNVESLLPTDWLQQVNEVVRNYGKFVEFKGQAVKTSRVDESFTTGYTVVKGPDIEANLPWLWKLYQGPFKRLVSKVAGQEVLVDPDPKFGANINRIDRKTQRNGYEDHIDVNDWTGMLGGVDIEEGDGGELVLIMPKGNSVETRIKKGWLYIFDGHTHTHGVRPLKPEGNVDTRITIPMDYILPGSNPERSEDMNAIFGNGHSTNGSGEH